MMVLRVYRITNTVFVKSKLRKNDLIIVVFYGNSATRGNSIHGEVEILYWMNWIYVDTKKEQDEL